MNTMSITSEAREKEYLSLSEAIILIDLYTSKNGMMSSSELKREILILNRNDYDEAEEGLENLRNGGYVKYMDNKWIITHDGTELFKKVSVFKEIDRQVK